MFERFTDNARRVVFEARSLAVARGERQTGSDRLPGRAAPGGLAVDLDLAFQPLTNPEDEVQQLLDAGPTQASHPDDLALVNS